MNEATAPHRGQAEDFMIVGIGASAGGLKPLREFFEHVPAGSGIAYVVVVHLSPEHESRMTDLLQQSTTIAVRAVTDTTPIEPDHVYVISPKTQLRVNHGKLEPTEARPRGSMTIDVFLETLAEAHGNRAVGVILSGSGSDGALGMRAIKAEGGLTIAQPPEEAEYDSMPRNAIASGAVDFVLPVGEIPGKIVTLWRNARAIDIPELPDKPSPEDARVAAEEALRDILVAVRMRTGHDFSDYKRATLMRRIERRMQVNQLQKLTDYRDYITGNTSEASALLSDFLISVTRFFRDPAAWQVLERRVLPAIFEARGKDHKIRVWVPGCATGEEVYSLAILIQERLDVLSEPPTVNIFATEIDEKALAIARAGSYPETVSDDVSPERLHRFFAHDQGRYQVEKRLRDMVMFAVHNVAQDPPFSRLDLICCRNLLIYLNRHAQAKVMDVLHFSLRPEGYLFLGMSESIDDGGFAPFDKASRIFIQQPRARFGRILASFPTLQPHRYVGDATADGGRRTISLTDLHQRLLEHYAPPSLVVDGHYNVVHLSDRAGHFLRVGAGEPSLNLLRVLPGVVRHDVKAALDQAIASMRTVECNGLLFPRDPEALRVDVKVHPVADKATGRTFALVILAESPGDVQGTLSVRRPDMVAESNRLEERIREMDAQLASSIEEYEVQNEELKASNEELRATTEELETGKEELQSINEELVTVNQELKNTVEETTRIADDLTNFVTATGIASLFIDRDMRLMRFTPYAREIFNVLPGDVGRPLFDITHHLQDVDLVGSIRSVLESLQTVEFEAKSSDDRWYIVRILPYRTAEDLIRGAVLTFIDISGRKRAEAAGRHGEAWAKLVIDSVREYAFITLDGGGIVRSWNAGAQRTFGYEESEIVGREIALLYTPEDRAANVPADELRRARETGRAEDDRWHVRRDGSRFFASGILAPVDGAGERGYVKVLRDLTEHKLAEERQLRLLDNERIKTSVAEQANRLKDEFLATLSHELRNPLALILMQAEILLRAPETRKSERIKRAATVIHEMVRAQAQIVGDMVDVARARTGKLAIDRQLLPLTFVIADSIGALRREAQQKDITLDVQTGEAPLIVKADPVRVRQIAWNLLTNAIKFTPPQGTVHVRLVRDGDFARLDVEDTGQGIAPEAVPYIFDWFHRARLNAQQHSQGMGIGLALVRQLVELHDGRVEAHSEGLGKGARFSVWLPLDVATPITNERAAPVESGEQRLSGIAVLIVDDSEANGAALRDLLAFEGARVTVEADPAHAIEVAKKSRFDVVISDLAMPEVDGYDMLKAIRAAGMNTHTPAIAYSGFSSPKDIELARTAGFDRHLTKPIDVETLLATIRDIAKPRRAAD